MFLSKIMISGAACRNPYEIHRSLWKLFPEDADADRDFLFRAGLSDRNRAEILMQSIREPVISSNAAQILACKEFPLSLKAGQSLRFMLIANPIKMINDESGRKNTEGVLKKCRVPLVREDDQRSWIERKLLNAATLESIVIDPIFPLRFRKGKDGAGKIKAISFQGILKIEEPESMMELVRKGIGPAKAFGCGLLSLARA
ncbi:MAG: type I-E CRISPR-associated protein Cas6/Cse3/CasE [Desulfoprunum sp.]|nr:type I-E CRISPR-associated protein Cas6/Cse3/CasE [Desulfoprunum sp.]